MNLIANKRKKVTRERLVRLLAKTEKRFMKIAKNIYDLKDTIAQFDKIEADKLLLADQEPAGPTTAEGTNG